MVSLPQWREDELCWLAMIYANVSFTDGHVDGEGGGKHAGYSVGTRGGGDQQLWMCHIMVYKESEKVCPISSPPAWTAVVVQSLISWW